MIHKNIINDGYIKPVLQEKDFIFGSNQLSGEILQPDGQWLNFLPPFEEQKKIIETSNCTGFATCNIVEIIMRRKALDLKADYSDRGLGILSGTYPPGNSPQKVAETARIRGFFPEELLSFDNTVTTVDSYYDLRKLTIEMLAACENWLKKWTLKHDIVGNFSYKIPNKMLMNALKYSPLGIAVIGWIYDDVTDKYIRPPEYERIDGHWTVMVGYEENEYWYVYDSYYGLIKLDWDFKFYVAKRYAVEQNIPDEQANKIMEMLKSVIQSLFLFVRSAYGQIVGGIKSFIK